MGPGVCVCARAGCVPGDGVGRERRSQAQRTTQCVCVCVYQRDIELWSLVVSIKFLGFGFFFWTCEVEGKAR